MRRYRRGCRCPSTVRSETFELGPQAATQLGFVILDRCATTVDGEPYVTAMLDFGPASVDGWFAKLDTLHYLVQRSGNAVHREEILSDVWGDAADVSSNVVDVVVRSLRKKLAERADVIETISGFGYRLCDGEATNE